MLKTGLVYDEGYLKHETGAHPENAGRLRAIRETLEGLGIWDLLMPVKAKPAAVSVLETTHESSYIANVRNFAEAGGGYLDEDTVVCRESYNAALLAAGGACCAVKEVMEGRLKNAFVMARPPGHHAETNRSAGFCLFNNVAVAAHYAMESFGCKKIMIIDWDVHHGNGTQRSFYGSRKVLYFSTHQQGIFPNTGYVGETGMGEGDGFNINVPLAKGTGDEGFYYVYHHICQPVIKQFQPELILISAGFDPHFSDPLAELDVTVKGFTQITRIILEAASQVCEGKVVALLEGGYNLATVGHCAAAVIKEMAGLSLNVEEPGTKPTHTIKPTMRMPIDEALNVHKRYWQL